MSERSDIRNLAIIAHVDHGKTTLVDSLLKVSGAFERGEEDRERAMDRGDIERERGITITSKPTSLEYGGKRINLVDTPGHADFGGEVERVLNMVDGVLLVVDAFEGPMPQTRFVTQKAIAMGLDILVVVNKIDRPGSEPHAAVDAVFDLLADLDASERQQDFPVVFCSAREGYAMQDPDDEPGSIAKVLDMILEHAPAPNVDAESPLGLWVSTLDHDNFLGYLAIGRIDRGKISVGDRVSLIRPAPPKPGEDTEPDPVRDCAETFRVAKLMRFQGINRFEVETASAGDIVAISGMESLEVGDTISCAAQEGRVVFPKLQVDPPTLEVRFRVNDGPFVGQDGKWVTSRKLAERLFLEAKSNVALQVRNSELSEEFEVAGRGELHLTVLMETMRREGYEFCVSRPKVIYRKDEQGKRLEPYENVSIECETEWAGAVIEELGRRSGEMTAMDDAGANRSRMTFRVPSRGLIGYRSEFLTATRGTGILSSVFDAYGPYLGPRKTRQRGVLIVMETGDAVTYSLHRIEKRGVMFVGTQTPVYAGMICGEHARDEDIVVNPCISKKHSNVRSSGADEKLFLTPHRVLSLEEALAFIEDDELIEVTPANLRLRKRLLDHNARKREAKSMKLTTEPAG